MVHWVVGDSFPKGAIVGTPTEMSWPKEAFLDQAESGWPCLPLYPQSLHEGRSGPSVLPIAGLWVNWPKWMGRGTTRPKAHPSPQGWDAEMDLAPTAEIQCSWESSMDRALRRKWPTGLRGGKKGFAVEFVAGRAEIWVCIEISTLTMTPRVGLQTHHCNLSAHHLLPMPLLLKSASAFLLQGHLPLDWGPSLNPR